MYPSALGHRNTPSWFSSNISLRHTTARSIGAYTLSSFPPNTVLGEYVGELIPASPLHKSNSSAYLFEVEAQRNCVGYLDSLRVGSWTWFINHSCRANVAFEARRVGGELRYFVVTLRAVEVGEELLINYGEGYWEGYWEGMAEKGIFVRVGRGRVSSV
jgi:SET domain-containing protein